MCTEFVGVDKLTKKIENFYKALGYDEVSCFMSHEFAYYDSEEISYTILEDELTDKGYANYLSERFDYVPKCSVFMFSLLHELGHHITLPLIKKQKMLKIRKTKRIFERHCAKAAKSPEQIVAWQVRYCKLYDERIATAKAVDILIQNYELVKKHETIIQKALKNFYQENNIFEI